jgi:hypothetical protein
MITKLSDRISKEDQDNMDLQIQINKIINARIKVYGKTSSTWVCSGCRFEMGSFVYNFDVHVPEICPQCLSGKMIEDESRREEPKTVNMIDGSREKNWEKGLSASEQAAVLLDQRDPY